MLAVCAAAAADDEAFYHRHHDVIITSCQCFDVTARTWSVNMTVLSVVTVVSVRNKSEFI